MSDRSYCGACKNDSPSSTPSNLATLPCIQTEVGHDSDFMLMSSQAVLRIKSITHIRIDIPRFQDLHGSSNTSDLLYWGAPSKNWTFHLRQPLEQWSRHLYHNQQGGSYSTRQVHIHQLRTVDLHISPAPRGGPITVTWSARQVPTVLPNPLVFTFAS